MIQESLDRSAVIPIGEADLQRLLLDIDVPDAVLRPYLRLDPLDGDSFRPSVVVDRTHVQRGRIACGIGLTSLNGIARWRRQQRYARAASGTKGLRIVAEGDSWLHFPFLVDDVVDHLSQHHAVRSLGTAGDPLRDPARQDELLAVVAEERPDIVLLSCGGDQVLGHGRLPSLVRTYTEGMEPDHYLLPALNGVLDDVVGQHVQLWDQVLAAGSGRIIGHSYDYAVPVAGHCLGRPFASLGIHDRTLRVRIIRRIIDRLHDALCAVAEHPTYRGRVSIADCRGVVTSGEWWDELHPTSRGFGLVAEQFDIAIASPN